MLCLNYFFFQTTRRNWLLVFSAPFCFLQVITNAADDGFYVFMGVRLTPMPPHSSKNVHDQLTPALYQWALPVYKCNCGIVALVETFHGMHTSAATSIISISATYDICMLLTAPPTKIRLNYISWLVAGKSHLTAHWTNNFGLLGSISGEQLLPLSSATPAFH